MDIYSYPSFLSLLKFYTKNWLQSYKKSITKKVLFIADGFIRRTRDMKERRDMLWASLVLMLTE